MKRNKTLPKTYEWNETKLSTITKKISFILLLPALLCAISGIIVVANTDSNEGGFYFVFFGILIFSGVILQLVSLVTSDKDRYSRDFLKNIKEKLANAKTRDEVYELKKYIIYQSTDNENELFRLYFPSAIRQTLKEVDNKLDLYYILFDFCKFNKKALRLTNSEDAIQLIDEFFQYQKKQNN